MKFFRYLFFFCFCFFSFNLFAQTQANFDIIDAFPNLPAIERPVDIQNAGDGSGRLFVASQTGKIFVFNAERSVQSYSTFLDISSKVTTAFIDGFLGFTFHPDFAQNGFFYVDYTAPNPFRTVISRFKVSESNPDAADTTSEFIIMEIPLPPLSAHNGGQLAFGPDGYLYISQGDGETGDHPWDLSLHLDTLFGKILRINVDSIAPPLHYSIPSDNPFVDSTSARKEIWCYGLRNPWRFAFDSVSNLMYCGDVGQNQVEEIDIIQKGKNYGWNTMEGTRCYNNTVCDTTGLMLPIYEYDHAVGFSIIGGYVYRGNKFPSLYGKYIFGDFFTQKIWAIHYDGEAVTDTISIAKDFGFWITSFGVDEQKEIYVASWEGRIYTFDNLFRTFKTDVAFSVKPNKLKVKSTQPAVLPNVANFRDTVISRFGGKNGIVLGIKETNIDSLKKYGWIRFKKGMDFGKFYTAIQSDTTFNAPFDSVRKSGSNKKKIFVKELKPNAQSYTNPLAQEFGVFKLNLYASKKSITPSGFDSLTYVDETSMWNGKTLSQIANEVDTLLSKYPWKKLPNGSNATVGSTELEQLRKMLKEINEAFYTPISLTNGDSVIANQGLKFRGTIALLSFPKLQQIHHPKVEELNSDFMVTEETPTDFSLSQNYPNPFNPKTVISFSLSVNGLVSLKVYDILGREVVTLIHNRLMDEGTHTVELDASKLTSGVYFYRLTTEHFTETKKMVLLR